jgi:hypothetical protein
MFIETLEGQMINLAHVITVERLGPGSRKGFRSCRFTMVGEDGPITGDVPEDEAWGGGFARTVAPIVAAAPGYLTVQFGIDDDGKDWGRQASGGRLARYAARPGPDHAGR